MTTKLILVVIGLTSISALSVPALAAKITSADIQDETIQSVDIKNGEVKNADLANDAVTTAKIKNGEVKTEDLASGAIQPKVHIVQGQTAIAQGAYGDVILDCPSGEVVTGGGFATVPEIIVHNNFPVDQNTWEVSGFNEGDPVAQNLDVYAVCLGPSP